MPKFIIFSALVFLFNANAYAQKRVEDFDLALPEAKVQNSLYNNLRFLDSRADTTNMGIVQVGAFNKKIKVVPRTPLSVQFNDILSKLAGETPNKGELLLQIRQFSFAEVPGTMSEKGYCYLRANLYAKKGDRYQKVTNVDTVVMLKSSIDVTKPIMTAGSQLATGFITNNLMREPIGDLYTYHDIANVDSTEKSKLKLYNTPTYADGVYTTYRSFMNQVPDMPVTLDGNDPTIIGAIKSKDANGKLQKLQAQNVYAFVYKGQPYMVTKFGYYELKKYQNDFLFTGRVKTAPNATDVMAASMFFGVIGGLLASNTDAMFDMKLDHLNGGFIRLRELPEPVGADQ